jgi:polysaccharide biosynthesis/export protein
MKSLLPRLLTLLFLTISLHAQSIETAYLLKTGDTIRISVSAGPDAAGLVEDFRNVDVQIRSDGKFSMPLLNNVPADGLTTSELRQILEGRLTRYLKQPRIAVELLKKAQ